METDTEPPEQAQNNSPPAKPPATDEPADADITDTPEVPDKDKVDVQDGDEKTEAPSTNDTKEDSHHKNNVAKQNQSSNSKSPVLTLSNSAATGGGGSVAEDSDMRNLEDYEPGSSSLTTPLSSSDLEQTPRSSSEADGGDGEKSEKSESTATNSITHGLGNSMNNNNGHAHALSAANIPKRGVTLQMLLAAGILKPGDATMSLEYHGQKFVGDLLDNGQIRSQETGQEFSSPSAWATACKQIINPEKHSRKSGCGWASIKHRNLKLDYYKTVWFKRLREGSIDLKHISNGATVSSSSSETEDEDSQFCVLKFGEHFEKSPSFLSAQQMGAKILISCTEFKALDRLQPFHVKVCAEGLALADLHCNIVNTECLGYISGHWNGDQNCLKMEAVHPTRILVPHSSSIECDMERNRVAMDIHKLGHNVVGWYHSHPKAPPYPTKDDVTKQLDYQVMMKGVSESSYIPCVGIIISPICYTSQEGAKKSQIQLYWVLPPPENRPTEMGRPMKIEYETYSDSSFNPTQLLTSISPVLNFYKGERAHIDVNDLSTGKFDKLKETLSSLITDLKENENFWVQTKELFSTPYLPPPSPCLKSPKGTEEDKADSIVTSPQNGQNQTAAASNASTTGSSPSSPETTRPNSPPPSKRVATEHSTKPDPSLSETSNSAVSPIPNPKADDEPEPMET